MLQPHLKLIETESDWFRAMERLLAEIEPLRDWSIASRDRVQALWNDYGEILRLKIENGKSSKTIIVKFIDPEPEESVSHRRKVNSYLVEAEFYAKYAKRLKTAKVAKYYGTAKIKDGIHGFTRLYLFKRFLLNNLLQLKTFLKITIFFKLQKIQKVKKNKIFYKDFCRIALLK